MYPLFCAEKCSIKCLVDLLLPLDGRLAHCRLPQQFAGTHLLLGGERHSESKGSCPTENTTKLDSRQDSYKKIHAEPDADISIPN